MPKHVWEQEAECGACKATGLYVGMAERDGSAVICSHCKGTGKVTLRTEWNDFEGRQERLDVQRVLQYNPGIGVGEGSGYVLEDFGGQPYGRWLAGNTFPKGSEMRAFICPAWWYQSANYKLKPDWDECIGIGSFSKCSHFCTKDACWKRFDKENSDAQPS